jgi:hypothetical protein
MPKPFNGEINLVIYAQGARLGGHSPLAKAGKLWYAYNLIGIPPEHLDVERELAAALARDAS